MQNHYNYYISEDFERLILKILLTMLVGKGLQDHLCETQDQNKICTLINCSITRILQLASCGMQERKVVQT